MKTWREAALKINGERMGFQVNGAGTIGYSLRKNK